MLTRWRNARSARKFYASFVRPGDLVFDVGANIGERIAIFTRLGARVVAIEPQQHCIAKLLERFGERIVVVPCGVADAPGTRQMAIADVDTVSTMEPDWVDTMTSSGRFGPMRWDHTVNVEVTTLDAVIAEHGVPAFTKIDVEGFEPTVLAGLTQPLPAVSFEFVRERPEATRVCVERLAGLAPTEFNYSQGESLRLASAAWFSADEVLAEIGALEAADAWGDVYARTTG